MATTSAKAAMIGMFIAGFASSAFYTSFDLKPSDQSYGQSRSQAPSFKVQQLALTGQIQQQKRWVF
jgi:hypothetical protein